MKAEDFLEIKTIAAALRCNAIKVCRWIDSGELTAINTGDGQKPRWLIRKTDFEKFLKSRSNVGAASRLSADRPSSQTARRKAKAKPKREHV